MTSGVEQTGVYGLTQDKLDEFEKEKKTETSFLYGGSLMILHNPNKHPRYLIKEKVKGEWDAKWKKPPSVTTIAGLKDKSKWLLGWQLETIETALVDAIRAGHEMTEEYARRICAEPEAQKDKASNIGKDVHDWCEKYIRAKFEGKRRPNFPHDEATMVGINAFLDWEADHDVKWVDTEFPIYSKKYHYIGRVDQKAVVDGKLCVVDLKTSTKIYDTAWIQTAAYLKADEEESKVKYEGRWIVRLAKETEEAYFERMEIKNERKMMLGKRVYNIPKYRALEAKFLDKNPKQLKADFDHFLALRKVNDWKKLK